MLQPVAFIPPRFSKAAAEIFAFIGHGQRQRPRGVGVDFGDGRLGFLHLLDRARIHGFAHGQA